CRRRGDAGPSGPRPGALGRDVSRNVSRARTALGRDLLRRGVRLPRSAFAEETFNEHGVSSVTAWSPLAHPEDRSSAGKSTPLGTHHRESARPSPQRVRRDPRRKLLHRYPLEDRFDKSAWQTG